MDNVFSMDQWEPKRRKRKSGSVWDFGFDNTNQRPLTTKDLKEAYETAKRTTKDAYYGVKKIGGLFKKKERKSIYK